MISKSSVLLPFLLIAMPAQAEEPRMDMVVVTGARLPLADSDRLFSALPVPADRLETGARLDDALRGLGGIAQFRRAGSRTANPTAQGVTLRGLGGNAASRALVLLDGIPQEDPFGGWIAWPALGLEPSSVLIQRGGGASLAGPGALTGALVMTTDGQRTGADAAFAGGSFETLTASARAGWQGETLGLWAAGLIDGSDGFVPVPQAQRGAADVAAFSRVAAGSLRAALPVGEGAEIQARLAAFRDRRGSGLVVGDNRTRGLDASIRLVSRGSDWRYEASAYFKHRNFRNGFAAADTTRATAALTLDQYDVPADGWGFAAEVRPPELGQLALRFGTDARFASGETRERFRVVAGAFTRDRRAGGDSRTLGGFADALLRAGDRLRLTGAVRIDHWKLNDGARTETDLATGAPTLAATFADRADTAIGGRLGADYAVTPAMSLRAAAYANSRAPTLNELYRPFRVGLDVTEANADLPMERLKGVEAGLRFQPASDAVIDITLFANRLNDAVGNVTLGQGPGVFPLTGFLPAGGIYRQRLPLDLVIARGIELWAQAPLGAGFSADASYTYADVDIRRAARAPTLVGLRPAQTPRHQLSARLGWERDGLSASLGLQHASSQFEDDANSRRLPAYWTLGASAGWQVSEGLRFTLAAENLTDARVVSALSATGIETLGSRRMIRAGLAARWR